MTFFYLLREGARYRINLVPIPLPNVPEAELEETTRLWGAYYGQIFRKKFADVPSNLWQQY